MKKYNNVPLESQLSQYERWAKCLVPGGVGNVFFLPYVGLGYRVEQFAEWMGNSKIIDLEDLDGEGVDLVDELPKKGKVIVILRRVLLAPDGIRLAKEIEKWLIRFEGGVLFIHECAPVEYGGREIFPSWVYAEQMPYQMLSSEATGMYIHNLCKSMNITIQPAYVARIVEMCGGWLWLVKDLVRSIVENPGLRLEELGTSTVFVQKVKLIWQILPLEYQQALMGHGGDDRVSTEMKLIGILDERGDMRGSTLSSYAARQKVERLKIDDKTLTFDGKDLSEKIPAGDLKVLAQLWQRQGEMMSREEVAKEYWGEQGGYAMSDWAIDQKMRRLRARIVKLGLPIVVTTKKGEGYGVSRD